MGVFESYIFDKESTDLVTLINNANAGFWEFDVNTNEVKWSNGFYSILGYEHCEIECSYLSFLENLLYHEDKNLFLSSVNDNKTI